jgi:hypothetical protein
VHAVAQTRWTSPFSNNHLSAACCCSSIKDGLLESVAANLGLCKAFRLNQTDPALPPWLQ